MRCAATAPTSCCAARRAARCRPARTTSCARRACCRRLAGRARVPAVLAVCDDDAVIGAPFYVMERVEGHVVTSAVPAALDSPEDRRRIGEELVDALVEVHAVDWRDAGLEGFGKPTGYLERQLRRFLGLWEHNRTREIPAVESVGEWLKTHLPRVRPGHDRPRRLPPRQHDVRARGAGPAGGDLRLGDGDDRRPAGRRRLPVHAVGRSPRPDGRDVRAVGRDPRGRLPAARRARRPLRGALGTGDDRHPLVPDAGAVEVDRLHGGQLQARARRAPPTTRT